MLLRGRFTDRLAGYVSGLVLGLGLLWPAAAAAELTAGAAPRLAEALQRGQAAALALTWTMGREGEAVDKLHIDGGSASLQHCAASGCAAVGSPLTLTAGQGGQLLSVLRAAELTRLRSAEVGERAAADRRLELRLAGGPGAAPLGLWQLDRADWPTPPDGYGPAEFLDELARQLRQSAKIRQPVPIPTTVAELQELRVQLRLTPRTRPGGLVTIEHGLVRVAPAEGSLPRSPLPRPFERPLTQGEEEQLLGALQAAQLDKLDQVVPRRTAPAIGDDDGRLVTLHLWRAEPAAAREVGPAGPARPTGKRGPSPELAPGPKTAPTAPTELRFEPRGIERYLADLLRSPAQPLCQKLVGLLLADPPPARVRGVQSAARAH